MNSTRKFMNKIILLACLILPLFGKAQIQLKGIVKDKTASIFWANIILTSQEGKIIGGTLTKEDGTFELKVKTGFYKVKISFLGFTDWEKNILIEKDTDLGTVLLNEKTGELKEVVVTAKKKLIVYKTDRLVFDVENSIATSGGDAVTAIAAAPGIIVQNNSISMLGKGSSRVMVDGRIIELSGDDLMNFLKSISAKDIKNVEVINNPPAKYEAAGDGGLINITLKKGTRDSWTNSTTLSYDQNTYHFITLRDNFLYNKNKLKFSVSAGAKLGNSQVKQDLNTYYPNGLWKLRYNGKQKGDNVSGRVALDYDLSDHTTIGVQYLGNSSNPDSKDLMNIKIHNPGNQVDSLLLNTGFRNLHSGSHTYNAHLISTLDTLNRKISFDLDYFKYTSKTDNSFAANIYSPAMEFLNTNQSARNIANRTIDNKSIKVDMEHPLKFVNLSYGAKISLVDSKGTIQYYNTISGTPVSDPNRSNGFDYKEHNQSVYINGNKDISSKLSLQAGLRIENTQTEGYSQTLNQSNKNNYLKLFPTFYISYKKNKNHNFQFNYGRRINRPDFGVLNPFRSYISSTSYSEGNPFLQPSFGDNFDFTYAYKGALRTNVFLNITSNGFGPVFTSDPETNILILTRQNYFKEYYYGIGENYTVNIASWWQSQNSVYLINSKNKFTQAINASPVNSPQLYFTTANTFSLSTSTKLQVDYMYSSRFKRGLYEFGVMSGLNVALKQNMLKDKMQLSLLVNDVFNNAYLKNYTSSVNGIKQVYSENNSSRFFRITLSYSFGNTKVNVKQRDFGNDEEQKRSN